MGPFLKGLIFRVQPRLPAPLSMMPVLIRDFLRQPKLTMVASGRRFSRAGAFTLVELMTVIAIIAVIVAMLLPAIAGAHRNAQQLQCAANLRTLGHLLMMHANDHGGYLAAAGNFATGSDGQGLDDPQTLGDPNRQRYDYYDNGGGDICLTAGALFHFANRPVRLMGGCGCRYPGKGAHSGCIRLSGGRRNH
jgi:prepilin-type N-terminal cleavage/methylation domain-containing protein